MHRGLALNMLFLLLVAWCHSQVPWSYSQNSANHIILLPASSPPLIDGNPISSGDYVGVFFDTPAGLVCGGYQVWTGVSTIVAAWGSEPGLNNGFISGESFKWKIWRASDGMIFNALASYSVSPLTPDGGLYQNNGLSAIATLQAVSPVPVGPGWEVDTTSQVHRVFFPSDALLLLNNQSLQWGDCVGAFFDSAGVERCIGFLQWHLAADTLELFGWDGTTGIPLGQPFYWKLWRQSDGFEIQATPDYNSAFPDSGVFNPGGFSGIIGLQATSGPDLMVSSWLLPQNSCNGLGVAEQVLVEVKNVGNQVALNYRLYLTGFAGGVQDSLLISTGLAAGASAQHSFPGPYDLSVPFHYAFLVVVQSPSDVNPLNDSLARVVQNNPIPSLIVVGLDSLYCQDPQDFDVLIAQPSGGAFIGTGVVGNLFIPAFPGVQSVQYHYANPITGCSNTWSMTCEVVPSPVPSLGNDTGFCEGASLVLDAGPGAVTYQWSTGQSSQTIEINTGGWYWVSVTGLHNCGTSDTLFVQADSPPAVVIFGQTESCQGGQINLAASQGFDFYLWNTGEMADGIVVDTSGWYQVTVTEGFCQVVQGTSVVFFPPAPISLQANDSACYGEPVLIQATPGYVQYFWSNGWNMYSETSIVYSPGLYSVAVVDDHGCIGTDSIRIDFFSAPEINWPVIENLCQGDTFWLSPGPAQTYLWSTGSTLNQVTATASGVYSVTLSQDGCSAESSADLYFFSPPKSAFSSFIFLDSVQFFNFSDLATGYHWDFGDGTTSSVFEPGHRYSGPGVYLVKLKVWGPCGDSIFQDTIRIRYVNGEGILDHFSAFARNGTLEVVAVVDQAGMAGFGLFDSRGRQVGAFERFLYSGENRFSAGTLPPGSGLFFLRIRMNDQEKNLPFFRP